MRPRKPSGPGGCAAIASRAGSTVFSTPPRLVSNTARTWLGGSTPPPVPAEMPALAMTRSSGPAAAIQSRMAAWSRTSSARVRTAAPRAAQDASTAASRAVSRPERCSVTPGAASASASARPMPEEAPVMRTLRQG